MRGVDGLRAFAALWVVLFHAWGYAGHHYWFGPFNLFIANGALGVSLFLVLSGFCLYVPFAGGRTNRFKTVGFFWRRCKRLLPAYYVTLLITLGLTFAAGHILGAAGPRSSKDLVWQAFSHAALIHNMFPSTFYAMNGAYWSLGLEWQLYLFLPLLVLGAVRIGLRRTLLLGLAINLVYLLALQAIIAAGWVQNQFLADPVLPNQIFGRWSEFLLGMVAAELFVTGRAAAWASRVRYPAILLALVMLVFAQEWWVHLVSGFVFFALLLVVLEARTAVARIFAWRPLVFVGLMSYSVYLVHEPLIAMFAYAMRNKLHMSAPEEFVALVAAVPFILVAAFILFLTVERRTLNSSGPVAPVRDFLPASVLRLVGATFPRKEAPATV